MLPPLKSAGLVGAPGPDERARRPGWPEVGFREALALRALTNRPTNGMRYRALNSDKNAIEGR